jgi:hypothetical protein
VFTYSVKSIIMNTNDARESFSAYFWELKGVFEVGRQFVNISSALGCRKKRFI